MTYAKLCCFVTMCEIDIGNPKYTTFTKLVQVRNFITFELKVIRHEETQPFYADCFYIISSQPNQHVVPIARKFVWPRPALNLDSLSFGSKNSTRWLFPNLKILSPHFWAWCHSHPQSHFLSGVFYFDICKWHILPARVWPPALMFAPN